MQSDLPAPLSKVGNVQGSDVMKRKLLIAIACLITVNNCTMSAAQVASSDNTDVPTSNYDEILELGDVSGGGLEMEAQAALRSCRYDRSIELATKSLAKNPDDIDTHRTYAEALEGKLEKSADKDPGLVRTCIKEWLCVMRSGVGEEKGITLLGPGLADFMYGDDDRYFTAKYHLKELVGTLPRPWETESMYLNRALKIKRDVSGKLIGSRMDQ